MKLLLVRHAESRGNQNRQWQGWLDEPLTERGQEQARLLAERLHQWSAKNADPIATVYSSTLTRAVQTASVLTVRCGVPLVLDWRLRERNIGVLQGLSWPDLESHYPEIAQHIRQQWTVPALPDGETTAELTERVWQAFEDIIVRTSGLGRGRSVAVVSHGGTLNAFLSRLVGRSAEMPFLFRFENTSLSIVELQNGRPRISLVNDSCHLD